MPSLRKKFTEFLRQLSANSNVHFDPETVLTKDDKAPGCFIQRYLNGEHKGGLGTLTGSERGVPVVFHGGKDGATLPNLRLETPHPAVFAAYTGPDGGLTTVNRGIGRGGEGGGQRAGPERHLSTDDPDVNFIDEGKEEGGVPKSTESKSSHKANKSSPPKSEKTDSEKSEENSEKKPVKSSSEAEQSSDTAEEIIDVNREIAGVKGGWNRWNKRAYGVARSLYERHPVSGRVAGSPVADAFAIVARRDSALLALADGVNWGPKAATAARAALHGSLRHLHVALYNPPASITAVKNTKDVFVALLRSFHEAHSMILQEEGMLTTLTVAAVLPISYGEGRDGNIVNWGGDSGQQRWAVCVVNVGDSLAYVYSKMYGVREITMGSHDIHCMRDMRDALGALGPADGLNPELNNLTCSMTIASAGDVVFLTSDGVSDNFDPVVGKFAIAKMEAPNPVVSSSPSKDVNKRSHRAGGSRGEGSIPTSKSTGNVVGETGPGRPMLPMVEAHQRHALTLLRMEDLLVNGVSGEGTPDEGPDAVELCQRLVDFATRLTAAKRHILEDPELYMDEGDGSASVPLGRAEQRGRRRKVCERLASVPGKLDHASVVAYVVGEYADEEGGDGCVDGQHAEEGHRVRGDGNRGEVVGGRKHAHGQAPKRDHRREERDKACKSEGGKKGHCAVTETRGEVNGEPSAGEAPLADKAFGGEDAELFETGL
ncbi:PP2C-like domain-containing protein CG9801 [Ischnura elegans]|uniref:PP2C-like domain-containing protein CG9801 n=1 Tax=Ischnura elegans TaxID=197161 RepID=UPI001ED86AC6|nr:PP2C-like domain-containing protein CG9801 [Ischnura elegans]